MDGHSQVESHRALVAMGGNEGDVAETFRRAIHDLNQRDDITVESQSELHATPAVGSAAGASFLNAAISLSTSLSPIELLDALQETERHHGRVRTIRWGPRTLDLDLIAFDDQVLNTPRLTLPHPGCWYRRFVLDSVVEIAGEWEHPALRVTFRELRERLLQRPLPVSLPGESPTISSLSVEFPQVAWVDPESAVIRFTSVPPAESFTLQLPTDGIEQFLRDTLRAATGE